MSVKVISQTTSIQLGDSEFPKNTIYWQIVQISQIKILTVQGNLIQGQKLFSEYVNSSGVPYTSLAALITDLRAAAFA